MKRLPFSLILFIIVNGCSPKLTPTTEEPFVPLEYEAIIEAPGLSEDEILKRISRYIVKSYNNYQSIFQYKDSSFLAINAAQSVIVPAFPYEITNSRLLDFVYEYQFITEAKPGRCKLTFCRFKSYLQANPDIKTSTPTKEVGVKNLMHRPIGSLEERNKYLERINLQYDQLNYGASSTIEEISDILTDPNYGNW